MRTVSQEGINFNHILTSLQSIQALKDYERKIYYFDEYYTDPVRLLIIGEFNAGKSTIINALLGRDVAAIGKVATTAVPTFLDTVQKSMLKLCIRMVRSVDVHLMKL